MGCGLSRPWKRQASVQSIRPLPESSPSDGEEEETPLLLAVREEVCHGPQADGLESYTRSAACKAGSKGCEVKVCGWVTLTMAIAALVLFWEPLRQKLHNLPVKTTVDHLGRLGLGPCFTEQIWKIIEWMILACDEHRTQLLLCGMLLPVLYVLKKCGGSFAEPIVRKLVGEEHVKGFFAKAEVIQMALLWLADMLSDAYVTCTYCKQKMYVFAFLMILIWLGSGCIAFGHRYVSWERCQDDVGYWAAGLNEHGEPKPGLKSFVLYVAQVQPVLMAWESWLHGMTRHLQEEKMLAALAEGAPSGLLQLYAMLLEPPKEKSFDVLVLCGSIAMSILTIAVGINKAYELCTPESRKMEKNILSPDALLCFRWCDSFSRIGVWALLGFCFRPIGAKRHGVEQPYLPLILAAELLLITAVFKSRSFGLNLAWSELFKKDLVVSIMASFLGTYWCCNTADIVAQHRLFRSLLVLRLLQTLGALWLCGLLHSASVGGACLPAEHPAVVIVALLVLISFAVTFFAAVAHDIAMTFFALPLFPIIAGWKGGRLELAARFGVASQIPRSWRAAADDEGVAALCQAAEAGQGAVIHALVDAGVSPTATWHGGHTALHWAAIGGHVCAIQALQSGGESDLERATDDGTTAAMLAALHGQLKVVEFLHSTGCDFHKADKDGYTASIAAADKGHLEVVKFLHRAGCDLDRADNTGWTAGILAAGNGHLEVVTFLQSVGCDLDRANNAGWTPGIAAAENGNLEMVKLLHSAGCDFHMADTTGWTAGIAAARSGHLEVVKYLHRAGCDLNRADNTGRTAGMAACQNGHFEVVKFLCSSGCDFDRPDNTGRTAGILAAGQGHLEIVEFLHRAGCDFHRADNTGWTAGMAAAENGCVEVVKYLRNAGCEFDRLDNTGWTAGIAAAANGHLEVVQLLHRSSCNFEVHSLHAATDGGHLSVVEFLLGFVDVNAAGIGRVRALDIAGPTGAVTEALLRAGASPGPRPRLVGLTALTPSEPPQHGYVWFTCGAPKLAQSSGKFYHEIQILSEFQLPQLGWLGTDFQGGDSGEVGVGDDANGWAFDGQRCCWWQGGVAEPLQLVPWKVNDVLGLAIDLDQRQMQLRTEQQELTMPFEVHGAVHLDSLVKFSKYSPQTIMFRENVCLFACLFVCLLVCLLACLFVCLFACLFVCLFVCLFACLFVCLFVCLLCIFSVFVLIVQFSLVCFVPFCFG